MNENVFKRIEQKYLMTKRQKEDLLYKIRNNIEKDQYYKSTICNIYFDNDNNDLIVASLEKPAFKAKLRLRSYNIPNKKDNVFLEIKDKYKGVVGKRRIKMTLEDFYKYLDTGIYKDNQIMKELDYYFKTYNLKPYIFVGYDRISYKDKNNKELRITIDSGLRSRKNNLKLELGATGEPYFEDDKYIMEIKALDALPLWLVKSLSELKIYPVSFSKVGNIYKKLKEREILC